MPAKNLNIPLGPGGPVGPGEPRAPGSPAKPERKKITLNLVQFKYNFKCTRIQS